MCAIIGITLTNDWTTRRIHKYQPLVPCVGDNPKTSEWRHPPLFIGALTAFWNVWWLPRAAFELAQKTFAHSKVVDVWMEVSECLPEKTNLSPQFPKFQMSCCEWIFRVPLEPSEHWRPKWMISQSNRALFHVINNILGVEQRFRGGGGAIKSCAPTLISN